MLMKTLLNTICLGLILSACPFTSAQSAKGVSDSSYKRARQVLDAGILALGGSDVSRKTEDISIKYSGKAFEQGQSANPKAPYYVRQEEGTRIIDLRGNRSLFESTTNYLGGGSTSSRQVLNDKSSFSLDPEAKVIYPIAPTAVAFRNRLNQRLFPHLLLQEALNRASTLRWLGEEKGREQIITFADAGGNQIALYFDGQTHLLTKSETLGDDPIYGDVQRENLFSDYRDVEGLKLPFRFVFKYAGEIVSDLHYDEIRLNTHPSDEIFQAPRDYEKGPETLGQIVPTVTKLSEGVYFLNGMSAGSFWFYSQLFVVFKDYVLVVESPLNNGISQMVMAKIKELIPGKPIKYLVPTHYHFDHFGGIRAYLAEGATVVTTPGNKDLIEAVAAAPHTINPDALSRSGRKPLIETFTTKRIISDGDRTVELYNVGLSPHADEIVVVYLPREKILFVSDLCMTRITGKMPAFSETTLDFDKKMRQLNLDVQTIANGHGWVGSWADFQRSLASNASQK